VRLVAEFTSEPFHGEGDPPAHALRAWDVVEAAGLDGKFGPLGTSCAGEADQILDTLRAALGAAFGAGADRVRVEVRDAAGPAENDEPMHPLLRALGPLLHRIGGELIDPADIGGGDVPVEWHGRLLAGVRLPATVPLSAPAEPATTDGQTAEPAAPGGLDAIIEDLERQLGPLADLSRSGKQQAVRLLEEAGAFSYRKSVEAVAVSLGVSRFTVYNYLNRERE